MDKLIISEHYLNQIIKTQARLARANFNLQAFMDLVAEQMQKLTPATGAVVELVENTDMVYKAATGTLCQYVGLKLPVSGSISGLCVKTRKILQCDDTEQDPRVNVVACRKVKARSLVVAPLLHEGKALGVLKIVSIKPKAFNNSDIKTLQLMAGLIGSALAHQLFYEAIKKLLSERTQALHELQKAEKTLKQLAHFDHLTGLSNKKSFNDKLKIIMTRAKQSNRLIALMYLDIDHFKNINDSLGHGIGDELLSIFARRLKHCLRGADIAGRLGGDEFAVILEDIGSAQNAILVARKILNAMLKSFKIENKTIKITTSIGVAFFQGSKINDKTFIKQADQALYAAKNAGRNCFMVFQD